MPAQPKDQGKKIIRKFRKYFETNENKNRTYQNFGDAGKAVLG